MFPGRSRAIGKVARIPKDGGRLAMVDMLPHDRETYRRQMGHVWLGFGDDTCGVSCPMPGLDR
jgi:ubiquinone/menaquinone biosynthesis C-methylase UbiE